jgi:hypothetical protein
MYYEPGGTFLTALDESESLICFPVGVQVPLEDEIRGVEGPRGGRRPAGRLATVVGLAQDLSQRRQVVGIAGNRGAPQPFSLLHLRRRTWLLRHF